MCFSAILFLISLLYPQCSEGNNLDYAEAIKRCAGKNSKKEQSFFVPNPDCIVGAVLPNFECTTIRDKKINKAYFKGKVSILNFWFEGCAPCVAEVPGFQELVKKYGKDRLNYLAISLDSKDDVEGFLAQHDWDFDHVTNGKSIVKDTFHLEWGYPTTFLIDQNGIIIKNINGGKQDSTASALIQEALIPSIESLLKQ